MKRARAQRPLRKHIRNQKSDSSTTDRYEDRRLIGVSPTNGCIKAHQHLATDQHVKII
jgi:hypothetical protein